MLEEARHDVALNFLRQGKNRALTLDLDGQQLVLLAQGEHGLVALEDDVLGVVALAVDNGGNLSGSTKPTCRPLAELGALGGLQCDDVRHVHSPHSELTQLDERNGSPGGDSQSITGSLGKHCR